VPGTAGIARWNGSSWSALGNWTSGFVDALQVLPNGELIAGGAFTSAGGVPANNIARWNGAVWSPLGAGLNGGVEALELLGNGDLVAVGAFTGSGAVPAQRIARWNGTSWQGFGGGITGGAPTTATYLATGQLFLGGTFFYADGNLSAYHARLATNCLPSATYFASGCAGGLGQQTPLNALTQPWAGTLFRAEAIGLPALAVVVAVTGLQPLPAGALPVASLFPTGVPGCNVRTTPDLMEVVLASNGVAQSQFVVPNVPAALGASLYHQMVPLEVTPAFDIVAVTATNVLQLVIGSF